MKTIHFVHDQQESPEPRRSALEASGFHVELFASGADCLARLEEAPPALVLLDVLVEGPHGFDVCRSIREKHPAETLPVILGSHVYRSRIYRDEATAAGAQRYLLYPADTEDLAEIAFNHANR